MTVVNLRGVKESGAAFAGPTYFYILMLVILLGTGFYRVFVQHLGPIPEKLLSKDAIEIVQEDQRPRPVHAAAGVLVRRRRPVGCRGGLQRRPVVQEAGEQERGDDAGLDGRHPRRRASSACRCWPRS